MYLALVVNNNVVMLWPLHGWTISGSGARARSHKSLHRNDIRSRGLKFAFYARWFARKEITVRLQAPLK